jgi:hypothetical protein
VGLRQLDRRDAQLALEHAAEMTVAHAQLAGELGHPPAVERARADPVRRHPREPRHGVDQRPSRRQLGAAAQARPKPCVLGGGRGLEEPAAVVIRHTSRADRPAVDPRRRDAHEEESVEAGVAGVERALAHIRRQVGEGRGGGGHEG